MTDDSKLRSRRRGAIRLTAIALGLLAIAFYIGFIVLSAK
jgi:hypothetical protein